MQSTAALAEERRFHPLAVARIVEETHDAKSIVFAVPAPLRRVFRYEAGQFSLTLESRARRGVLPAALLLACQLTGDRGRAQGHGEARPRGAGLQLGQRLSVGARWDVVSVLPAGGAVRSWGRASAPLLLFAGGSGITPVISILKTALATTTPGGAGSSTRTATPRSIDLRARELGGHRQLAHPRVARKSSIGTTTRTASSTRAPCERWSPAARSTATCVAPRHSWIPSSARSLRQGVERSRVRVERFVSASDTPKTFAPDLAAERADVAPASLTVTLRGKRSLVPYEPGKSILRAALDAGLDAPYSCEEGFCGCCVARVCERDRGDGCRRRTHERGQGAGARTHLSGSTAQRRVRGRVPGRGVRRATCWAERAAASSGRASCRRRSSSGP